MPPAAFLHPQNAPKSSAAAWGYPPDPAVGAYSAPQTPSWIKGATLLRGGEKERSGREANKRKGEGKGGTLDPRNVGNRLTPQLTT